MALRVASISERGVVGQRNRTSTQQLREGDVILEINGVKEDVPWVEVTQRKKNVGDMGYFWHEHREKHVVFFVNFVFGACKTPSHDIEQVNIVN